MTMPRPPVGDNGRNGGDGQRTVENHVSHILQKLGLGSRTALAVWVERSRSDSRSEQCTVLRAAEAAGRSREDLTFVYNVGIAVGPRTDDTGRVTGSPEEVAERLTAFEALGFDAINVWPAGDAAEQRHRIAEEVLPLLR